MAAPSSMERELQLLDSVEFRILAVANNEDKLSQLLQRYLTPVLLKAASEHAAVRTKVVQIYARLKTFIQPPGVVLPVKALMEQYKSNESPLVKQLDISGIQHSLERIDDDARRDLIPVTLRGCSKDEGQARAGALLYIILRLLLNVNIPPRGSKDDENFKATIGISEPADAQYLARLIGVFLRLRAPVNSQTWASANPTLSPDEIQLVTVDNPSGMKVFQRMSELKAKLVALLASGAFTDEEKFLTSLYGASNPDNRVAAAAEEILKRSSVSMEDEAMVKRLFQVHSTLPAAYRTRILTMLCKSSIAATMSDEIMAVVNLDFAPADGSSNSSLQPSSVLERRKLDQALFKFIAWVAQVGPSKSDFKIGPPLIKHMQQYIEAQGWPVATTDSLLRGQAYETIGILSRSAGLTAKEVLSLAAWLFKSLSEDPSDTVVNIDGALSSLTAAIPAAEGDDADELKTMLLRYMYLPDQAPAVRSTRHAVVKWANQCIKFSDITGRWIDLLAIDGRENERSDVIEQGRKGLDPWTYYAHVEKSPALPDWKEMVITFFGSFITPDTHSDPQRMPNLSESSHHVFENFAGQRQAAFPTALRYCYQIMLLTALDDFKVEANWMQALSGLVETDMKTREKIREYLHSIDSGFVVFYLRACIDGASRVDSPITEECIRCFVNMASLSPGGAVGYLTRFSDRLSPLITSNNKEIRALGAQALGILVSHLTNNVEAIEKFGSTLSSQFGKATQAVGSTLNIVEGACLTYGHLYSRSVYYGQSLPEHIEYPSHFLIDDGIPQSLHETALRSFAQLWTAGLTLPPSEGTYSLENVVKKLAGLAKKGNEKAVIALGRLAVGLEDNSDDSPPEGGDGWSHGVLGSILKELFALHELKQVEIHLTVGDAITAAIARWDSDYVKLTLDVEPRSCQKRAGSREARVVAVLDKLFVDCKTTKPSLLKASGLWLFCIVQYCSHLKVVQSRLREAQAAFMRLLSARDELVQETASRGLSLVYERGDADLKSALVKDLVSAFTGSSTQLKVDEDTELFEPGALPTGEGNSITSYKDIVNLANEVGDQRLVYKFMSLAANAATWTTRSAFGRFGLSSIISESEVDANLCSKLYRYRFDPNQNVQRTMEDIWNAVVKDSNATVDKHFDTMMEDLLKSILGREWRVREASCGAISNLIQGRPFPQYEKYYRDIWNSALKVLDDVKGTVRKAALQLCIALSTSLVRQLEDGGNGAAARAMIQEALPFLLSDKGVDSSVQEVRLFATGTVIKIAKQGGNALEPFIPDMVPQILGLLSSIEPEQINYYYQRAGEDNRDEIDKLRSQIVERSPLTEAIDNALRFVDADVMAALAPKLEATIKSAIGMPTKVGCSRVLTVLFTRHIDDIKPFSARFLQMMEKQTMDKNDEVSQAYARATAYMLRVASDASKQRFCEKFINMYFQAEEESRRQRVAMVVVALAKISPDHFSALETELLPFAYLGSHDTDESTSKAFKEVWNQHAGTSRTVVRYVTEIVSLVERCLDTTQWALRHGGAFTVAAMAADVAKASEASGQINDANLKAIWPVFDKVLALKTFAGKEKLLDAYPKFVEKGRALWAGDDKISAQMKKIAIREAKRNNDEYRVYAFAALWKFAKARDDLDILDDIATVVTPYLEEMNDEDKMDVDSKDSHLEKTAKNGLEAIARGYSRARMQEDATAVLGKILDILKPFLSSTRFSTIKRQVWYECVRDMMDDAKSKSTATNDDKAIAFTLLNSLDPEMSETGTESQRVMRASAIGAVVKARARDVFGKTGPDGGQIIDLVSKALASERSLEVQKVLRGILEGLEH